VSLLANKYEVDVPDVDRSSKAPVVGFTISRSGSAPVPRIVPTPFLTCSSRIENSSDGHRSKGPDGSVWADEPMYEFEPPRRLVHGWRSLYDPDLAGEDPSRVTWEIEPQDGGYCLLTVTHDRLDGAPKTAESVAGVGWMIVLSGLKTLLKTGEPLVP
jgi:hypothetical protein